MGRMSYKIIMKLSYYWWKFKGKTSVSAGEETCTVSIENIKQAAAVYNLKFYEKEMMEEMISSISNGDTVMDIGANIGIFSCLAAKATGTEGEVISIEPFAPNVSKLEQVISSNNLSNIKVIEKPLSDKEEEVTLDSRRENSVDGIVTMKREKSGKNAVKGDSLIKKDKFKTPDVIKIDVEGAEGPVLKGLEEVLEADNCSKLFLELHYPATTMNRGDIYQYNWDENRVYNFLEEKGFEVKVLAERTDEDHLIAEK